MPDAVTRYAVFLRSGFSGGEHHLLSKFAKPLTTPSGESVLVIDCTEIDESHHSYLRVTAIRKIDNGTYTLRVPHHFVALIAGDESAKSIGFLANLGD